MSPGSTPGAWSASPENVIFCPCFMPLSTWTSRSFVSLHTFWPSHFLQRSFSFITSPGQDDNHFETFQKGGFLFSDCTSFVLEAKTWLCRMNYPLRCSLCTPTASAEPSQEPAVWSWFSFLFLCRPHTSAPLQLYLLDYKENASG